MTDRGYDSIKSTGKQDGLKHNPALMEYHNSVVPTSIAFPLCIIIMLVQSCIYLHKNNDDGP